MGVKPSETARRMLEVMAQEAFEQARSNLTSLSTDSRRARALREDLRVQIVSATEKLGRALVLTDFYWAVYYHDGRGPIKARPGKFLVFFRDPDDDPRIDGSARNYPRRISDARKLSLSKGQFSRLLRSGRLIATKRVGPAEAHPFFEVGFAALQARYGPKVRRIFSECVLETLAAADLLDAEEEITFEL